MKKKGLRKAWKVVEPQKPISVDELKGYLMGIFKDMKPLSKPLEWTHHVWEEDGQQCSMWCTNTGMCTGDLGYERFNQAFIEECDRLTKTYVL